ncbi:hypothetical protein FEM33_15515 [Dyadobacter flavalbus]|uniref:Uncharacterized protein n=1 Tax=Dyadobacter flavalbus TaxID=2579942 RepID=A0A5M8QW07_9BACT|nr:hypothetical protein [Dyadobacter flavalbus]KAA6438826.1 hypothetical protein FEM33_15515 [Dyadobacter flavalbus]
MNGYLAGNAWARFVRANGRKVKSIHVSLMSACYQIANEDGWSSEFQLPTKEAMELSCIRDKETFYQTLKDLVSFGAISIIEESVNRYTARWVSFENLPFYLSEIPAAKPTAKPTSNTTATPSATPTTNRPNTKEYKTKESNKTNETLKTDVDADRVGEEKVIVVDPVKEEKKETPSPKVAPKGSPSVHEQIRQKIEALNEGYYWQGKDGKALSSLITKIKFKWKSKHGSDPTDQQIVESFHYIIDNLPDWYRNKWDTCTIESKFESIIKQINENRKNGKPANLANDTKPNESGISPRLQRTWELIAEHYQGDPA